MRDVSDCEVANEVSKCCTYGLASGNGRGELVKSNYVWTYGARFLVVADIHI